MHARAGSGLVEQVDCLVGQEAVLNVAIRKRDCRCKRLVGIANMVMGLVGGLQALKDLKRVLR